MTELDPTEPVVVERTDERPGAGITVFLAEDEAVIRLDLHETLSDMGYLVVGETGRGDEAEDLIRALKPDLAILDIKMPGRTGVEVAESLSADRVCALVVLSAFSQLSLVEQAAEAGVLAYLLKPFQRSELAVSIGVALARHNEMVAMAGEVDQLERRLADRVLYDRAKGILIDQQGFSEADAMRALQKMAMDQRRPAREVAAEIIESASAF